MKIKRILIWLSIPLVILLAYLLKDSVRIYVIDPVIYLVRIAGLVYEALPQALWWGLFLVVLVIIALRSLRRERLRNLIAEPERENRSNRSHVWAKLIQSAQRGNYSRWLLAREMGNLTLQIVAHQERLTLNQARNRMQSGQIKLPPEIHEYVLMGLEAPSFRHYSDLISYMRVRRYPLPQDIAPEKMIKYLESKFQMEAPRDNIPR